MVPKFDKYLGFPAQIVRSKAEVFSYLKERLWSRVRGWNEHQLSTAGREVLIKAVLQAILTYVMSCFKLPVALLEEVEKIIRRFWWGSKDSKGIPWLAWGRLHRPKAEGGMGIRDMALLTKQAWRITTNPDLLVSRILKARYFPTTSFFLAEVGESPSLTWRSIVSTRAILESGLRRRIGNGRNTPIWDVSWLTSEGTGNIITSRPISSSHPNMVSDLINGVSGAWDLEKVQQYLWPCDVPNVLWVPVGSGESLDSNYWFYSKHGHFTVRSC